jgi:preprotein translocase subunit YajC
MTTSGIHGTVSRLNDATVDIEIAPGTVVTFERRAVMQVVQPTATDATGTAEGGDPAKDFPAPGDDTPGGNGTAGPTR